MGNDGVLSSSEVENVTSITYDFEGSLEEERENKLDYPMVHKDVLDNFKTLEKEVLGEEQGALDSDHATDDIHASADVDGSLAPDEKPIQKKKKKKKKMSAKNKLPPATGFEEFYADAPITPDDYQDECHDLYHYSRPFHERIEFCIQRYRARRKLDERRANVFSKYLTLGGVDSGAKAFTGGLDQETLENSTAAEIQAIQATDHIRSGSGNKKYYDPNNAEHWVVDFEGVVKGFLAPNIFGADSQRVISEYCGVIRNFLNYVLSHSVCPEYTNDIIAARKVCDLAEKELWAIHQLQPLLPGIFNEALSTLFGGRYHDVDSSPWPYDEDSASSSPVTLNDAQRILEIAVSLVGDNQQFEKLCSEEPKLVKEELRSMEVVSITLPDEQIREAFKGAKDISGITGNIQPLGLLETKRWINPEVPLPDDIHLSISTNGSIDKPHDIFWIDGQILKHCFVGMKFEAIVRELDIGIKYFDALNGIYCSFFTYLPNEMMSGWKEPAPNPRPAPSVDDPEKLEVFADGKDDAHFAV